MSYHCQLCNASYSLAGYNDYTVVACIQCSTYLCSDHMSLLPAINSLGATHCTKCKAPACPCHMKSCFKCPPTSRWCTNISTKCAFCNNYTCSDHKLRYACDRCAGCRLCHMNTCSSCNKKVCPKDILTCGRCNKSVGACHATQLSYCKSCKQISCSKACHDTPCTTCLAPVCPNAKCKACGGIFCAMHAALGSKCTTCRTFMCGSHVETCKSCNLTFCPSHINQHTSKINELVYCWNSKEHGRYSAPQYGPADGVGTFVWPNGQRTMCWFHEKKLIMSKDMTPNECVSDELLEQKIAYEKYKKEDEERYQQKHKLQEDQEETIRKQREEELERMIQAKMADVAKREADLETAKKQNEADLEQARKNQEEHMQQQLAAKTAEIEKHETDLKQDQNKLEEAKVLFEEEKEKSKIFLDSFKGPIKLNVGGTIYQTTQTNLSKYPSMLQSMFSGRFEIERDENNAVFIDRDGSNFKYILNFFRDGDLPTTLSPKVKEALKAEANFYQIDALIEALKQV